MQSECYKLTTRCAVLMGANQNVVLVGMNNVSSERLKGPCHLILFEEWCADCHPVS